MGFGSPAYFDKCFHEYFGYPPGDVRKRILHEPYIQGNSFHNSHVWSAIFDRKVTDIIDIQNDIALNVALKLDIVLSEAEKRLINTMPALGPGVND